VARHAKQNEKPRITNYAKKMFRDRPCPHQKKEAYIAKRFPKIKEKSEENTRTYTHSYAEKERSWIQAREGGGAKKKRA